MEMNQAIQVVKKLARGVNPLTDEEFERDSVYNNPTVIRALYVAIEQMPRGKKTPEEKREQNRLKGAPLNSGLPWTKQERDKVAQAYKQSKPIEQIASEHERSLTAIVAELERQGVISSREAEKLGFIKRVANG